MGRSLDGKKTYLLAAFICAGAVGLVFAHRITPTAAFAVALFVAGCLGATFRAVLQQHHDEAMEILNEVAETGAAVAAHNLPGAFAMSMHVAEDGSQLARECREEAKA